MANTIADLSTIPQDYVPYPDNDMPAGTSIDASHKAKCVNCTVHMGFMRSCKAPFLSTESIAVDAIIPSTL